VATDAFDRRNARERPAYTYIVEIHGPNWARGPAEDDEKRFDWYKHAATEGSRRRTRSADTEGIILTVESFRPTATCPVCGRTSERMQSHYQRRLADLPWHGGQVTIQWRSRRFFCDVGSCPQKIEDLRGAISSGTTAKRRRANIACGGSSRGCGRRFRCRFDAWRRNPARKPQVHR
jgi:hypothetical protein